MDTRTNSALSLGPNPLPIPQALVEVTALPDTRAKRARLYAKLLGGCFHVSDKVHAPTCSVINHIGQAETSHSHPLFHGRRQRGMDENAAFRTNLLAVMREKGMTAAELSRKAGLNARAVKDIEEGRVQSPKLSTVFALSRALGEDPGEMMGLGPRAQVQADLAQFLARYSPDEQARFLAALRLLPVPPAEER